MKVITANEAAALLRDGCTLAVGGFGAYGAPDELLAGLEDRYAKEGHPKALTLYSTICTGDFTDKDIGHNRLRAEGLLDTVIAAHFRNSQEMDRLVGENLVAGYTLPLGVDIDLLQAAASKQPGVATNIGVGTYIDPRVESCAVNAKAKAQGRELVSVLSSGGKDFLFYHTVPLDVCFIRGTYADEDGNIPLPTRPLLKCSLKWPWPSKQTAAPFWCR